MSNRICGSSIRSGDFTRNGGHLKREPIPPRHLAPYPGLMVRILFPPADSGSRPDPAVTGRKPQGLARVCAAAVGRDTKYWSRLRKPALLSLAISLCPPERTVIFRRTQCDWQRVQGSDRSGVVSSVCRNSP